MIEYNLNGFIPLEMGFIVKNNVVSYTYELDFDANGGSGAPASMTYGPTQDNSHTFTIPNTVPTRTGYHFMGWAVDSGSTIGPYSPGGSYDMDYPQTSVTLYAVWGYEIDFAVSPAGYGTVSDNSYNPVSTTYVFPGTTWTVDNGSDYGYIYFTNTYFDVYADPASATAQYTYAFDHWELPGDTPLPSSGTVTGDMMIYAVFTRTTNTYTVIWQNYDGTTLETDSNVPYGTTPTYNGATPTKPSATFTGWSPTVTTVTGNQTYTALFDSEYIYTVTYASLIGSGLPSNYTYGPTTASSLSYTVSSTEPTDSTWNFCYWVQTYNDISGSITRNPGDSITIPGSHPNITLTAQWYNYEFNLSFDANGGSGAPSSMTSGTTKSYTHTFIIPNTVPTKSGYRFMGWNTASDGSGTTYQPGDSIERVIILMPPTPGTHTSNATMYAVWAKEVTVTFNANGGTTPTASKTVAVGQIYGTLPTPTRTDYIFTGWYDAQSGGNRVTADTVVTTNTNHTLWAYWTSGVSVTPTDYATYAKLKYVSDGMVDSQRYVNWELEITVPRAYPYGASFDVLSAMGGLAPSFGYQSSWFNGINISDSFQNNSAITSAGITVSYGYNSGAGAYRTVTVSGNASAVISAGDYTFTNDYVSGYQSTRWMVLTNNGVDQQVKNFITITVHAEPHIYALTYDTRGGTFSSEPQTVFTEGTVVTLATNITKEGYTFNAWMNAGVSYVQLTMNSDKYVYADWTPNTYTISFDVNGGDLPNPSPITVTFGQPYGTLPSATRAGYTLEGWYTLGNVKITAETVVDTTINYTLYAHWTGNDYTVTFDANGGTTPTASKTVKTGTTYGTLPTPTRAGHTFVGWFTQPSSGTAITSETTSTLTHNQTLYAHWTVNDYTVTFNANGGTTPEDSREVTYGQTYGELPIPTRTGYDFLGWFTAQNGGNQIVGVMVVTTTSNQTLWAHWAVSEYTMTFVAGTGGTVSTNELTVAHFTTYSVNNRTLVFSDLQGCTATASSGYTFAGWSPSSGTVTGAITFTASFTANTYTVSFNANGGTTPTASKTVTYGQAYDTLPTPTWTGHTFTGWYTAQNSGTQVTSATTVTTAGNHTLWAHWDANPQTITFTAGTGGSVSSASITTDYGTSYTISGNTVTIGGTTVTATPNSGYSFGSWSPSTAGTVTSDMTFAASFTANTYIVTFDPFGGTVSPATITVTYGQEYGDLPTPVLAHNTFDGWYLDGGFTEITSETIVTTASNHDLIAHWSAIFYTYTVTYDVGSGTGGPSNYSRGPTTSISDTYTIPNTEPTRTGYLFSGWTSGGNNYSAGDTITLTYDHPSITLTALWYRYTFNLVYDANGGSGAPATQTYGPVGATSHTFTVSGTTPTKSGYDFVGWSLTQSPLSATVSPGDSLPVSVSPSSYASGDYTSTTTLYAVWGYTYTVTYTSSVGTGLPATYTYGPTTESSISYTISSTIPTDSSWNFSYWAQGASERDPGQTITISSSNRSITLTAQWYNFDLNLAFNANGGTGAPASMTSGQMKANTYTFTVPNTEPTRADYFFKGWASSSSASTPTYFAGDEVEVVSAVSPHYVGTATVTSTLYAVWGNTYTVTWVNYNDTVLETDLNVHDGATPTYDGATPTRPADVQYTYTFSGWSPAVGPISADTTYKAQYSTTTKTYAVTFTAGSHGSVSAASVPNVPYGTAYTISGNTVTVNGTTVTATPDTGYKFSAWSPNTPGTTTNTTSFTASFAPNTYTVTFNANGGSTPTASKQVTYDSEYGDLPTPTRTGYTFVGWFTEQNSGTQVISTTTVTTAGNHPLYAHWTANQYTVYFNANGGSTPTASKPVTYDSEYGILPIPTRSEYAFVGWFTEQNGGTQITSATTVKITADKTLYAHWSYNVYTITWDPMGGWWSTPSNNQPVDTYIEGGDTVANVYPSDPFKPGFVFAGWWTSVNGGTQVTSSTEPVGSVTYYAHWTTAPNISFIWYGNGGTWNVGGEVQANMGTTQKMNTLLILPTTPTYTGYTFVGWFTQAVGGTQVDGTMYATSADTYYAHWTANENTVICQNYDGTVLETDTGVLSGTTPTYDGATPTRAADVQYTYTFSGWNPPVGAIYGDTTYIAQYSTTTKTYAVTFTAGTGGTVSAASVLNVPYGTAYTINANTVTVNGTTVTATPNSGYSFGSWSPSTSGTTTDSTAFVASFTPNKYIVTLDAQGGSVDPASIEVTYTSTYGPLPTPTKYGFNFAGWWTEAVGGTQVTSATTVSTAANDTLYAHWTVKMCLVSFPTSPSGIGITIASINVPVGTTYTASDNILTFDDPNFTNVVAGSTSYYGFDHWGSESGTIVDDTPIIAYYHVMAYTVTFNAMGGTLPVPASREIAYGDTYGELPATSRAGYTFDGWFTQSTGGTEVTSETLMTREADHTLYAQWTPETYTVTFDANGGTVSTASKTVTYDSTYGVLPVPTYTGFFFVGWFTEQTGGTEVTSATVVKITEDQTLYAHWIVYYYELDYDVGEGSGAPATQTYGPAEESSYTFTISSSEPTRADYFFIGWTDVQDGNVATYQPEDTITVTGIDGDTATVTLYAVWRTNYYYLNYVVNDGEGGPDNDTYGPTTDMSHTFTISNVLPTRDKYDFVGWYSVVDDTTYYPPSQEPYTVTMTLEPGVYGASKTLTAQWAISPMAYSLIYNDNGGEDGPGTDGPYMVSTTSYSFIISDVEPTFTHKTFVGWVTQPMWTVDSLIPIYTAGDSFLVMNPNYDSVKTATLYAAWADNPIYDYRLYYDANGGSFGYDSDSGTDITVRYTEEHSYNTSLDMSVGGFTPKRDGYRFLGWAESSGASVPTLFGGDTTTVQYVSGDYGTKTIYAVWTELDDSITYWSNGEYNASVSVLFRMDDPFTKTYYLNATAYLQKFMGTVSDTDSSAMFTPTGHYVTVEVSSNPVTGNSFRSVVTATLYNQNGQAIKSASLELGAWNTFIVTMDVHDFNVSVTKVSQFASFNSYVRNDTTTVINWSEHLSYPDITLNEIEYFYQSNAPRQQVTETLVFLNTYGIVMKDPYLNIDQLWPSMQNVRFNFFSFALYGSTATINGITFPIADGKITIPYNNSYSSYSYDPDSDRTKTFDFTNFYLTWENGHCYISFYDDSIRFDLGEYTDRVISFGGVWYFSSAIYEAYTVTETEVTKDWWDFNFDFTAFALILAGLLTLAGIYMRLKTKAKAADLLIIIGGIVLALIFAGGLLI